MAVHKQQAHSASEGGIPLELGRMLREERIRQNLTPLDVTVATRCGQISMCETGHRAAWSSLQPYVEFLSQKAGPTWIRKANKVLDAAIEDRCRELSPSGQIAIKAYMLKACRGSSVGRAAAYTTRWDQLKLFPIRPRILR